MQVDQRLIVLALMSCLGWIGSENSVTAGTYGWWKLDEGKGETVKDSGPKGTTGDIFNFDIGGLAGDGSVWVKDPVRGNVISFSGEGDGAHVRAGSIPLMTLDIDFTWAFWARQDADQATPANDIILGNRMNDDAQDFSPRQFIKFTPNRFEYHMNGGFIDDLPYNVCACDEGYIPSDDTWIHHAVVKDGAMTTYYRDGEEMNSKELEQDLSEEMPFFMGGDNENNAGENWRGYLSDVRLFDHALTVAELKDVISGVGQGTPGDFNGDSKLDVLDINALTTEVLANTNNVKFDVTTDGKVDQADRTRWVKGLRKTWFGDANLDGEFNSGDFVSVFTKGEYEDTAGSNSTWDEGDWNGDSEFNSSDFVAAFTDGGYEKGPVSGVAAVPEPSTIAMLVMGMFGLLRRRRKMVGRSDR